MVMDVSGLDPGMWKFVDVAVAVQHPRTDWTMIFWLALYPYSSVDVAVFETWVTRMKAREAAAETRSMSRAVIVNLLNEILVLMIAIGLALVIDHR